jgi:uncharacterized membrane protein YgdD (TMEM256/DUF423 family)
MVAAMNRDGRFALLAGALFAAVGVALGAFGAHGLRQMLDATRMGWWHTAVDYQMWHAIALVALSAVPARTGRATIWLLSIGILLFSGSLYLMALAGWRWLGIVTPLGGAAMIAGWLVLAWRVAKTRPR